MILLLSPWFTAATKPEDACVDEESEVLDLEGQGLTSIQLSEDVKHKTLILDNNNLTKLDGLHLCPGLCQVGAGTYLPWSNETHLNGCITRFWKAHQQVCCNYIKQLPGKKQAHGVIRRSQHRQSETHPTVLVTGEFHPRRMSLFAHWTIWSRLSWRTHRVGIVVPLAFPIRTQSN